MVVIVGHRRSDWDRATLPDVQLFTGLVAQVLDRRLFLGVHIALLVNQLVASCEAGP